MRSPRRRLCITTLPLIMTGQMSANQAYYLALKNYMLIIRLLATTIFQTSLPPNWPGAAAPAALSVFTPVLELMRCQFQPLYKMKPKYPECGRCIIWSIESGQQMVEPQYRVPAHALSRPITIRAKLPIIMFHPILAFRALNNMITKLHERNRNYFGGKFI